MRDNYSNDMVSDGHGCTMIIRVTTTLYKRHPDQNQASLPNWYYRVSNPGSLYQAHNFNHWADKVVKYH